MILLSKVKISLGYFLYDSLNAVYLNPGTGFNNLHKILMSHTPDLAVTGKGLLRSGDFILLFKKSSQQKRQPSEFIWGNLFSLLLDIK